jgi:membrane-associated phospholipid phosphatase
MLVTASAITSALLMSSTDKLISDYMRESELHNSTIINTVMKGGDMWGFGSIFLSCFMYILLENKELGLTTLKATLLGCTVSRGLTIITGRGRPFYSPNNSMNFNLFKGLKYSLSSLPSGHSTVAFAFAAAADKLTPQSQMKTALLYSMAVITAISRIYHDKHWLSDVIMGSTLGYLIGSKI